MSANKLPAADEHSFCAKHGKNRSENRFRQAALRRASGLNAFPAGGQEQGFVLVIAGRTFNFQVKRFE